MACGNATGRLKIGRGIGKVMGVVMLGALWPAALIAEEPQDEKLYIGPMGLGLYAENAEIQEFASSLTFLLAQVFDEMPFPETKMPFGFLFISGDEVLKANHINPDVLPFFSQSQKDVITRTQTPQVDCFVQAVNFNGRIVVVTANDTTAGGVPAGEKCVTEGLLFALGKSAPEGLWHEDNPTVLSSLSALFSQADSETPDNPGEQ